MPANYAGTFKEGLQHIVSKETDVHAKPSIDYASFWYHENSVLDHGLQVTVELIGQERRAILKI
jgi:hypothetical protein